MGYNTFDKLEGFHIGTVKEHCNNGLCKVFIHGVYPEELLNSPDKLPTAIQIAPLFGGSAGSRGNGVYSYPNIGAIVLCAFLNGDLNRPIILGAIQGGTLGSSSYIEARTNVTPFTDTNGTVVDPIKKGIDAFTHVIKVKNTTITLSEEGLVDVLVSETKTGPNSAHVQIKGDGNITLESSRLIHLLAPAITITGTNSIQLKTTELKIDASSKVEITTPTFQNTNSISNTVISKTILHDAKTPSGTVINRGERENTMVS